MQGGTILLIIATTLISGILHYYYDHPMTVPDRPSHERFQGFLRALCDAHAALAHEKAVSAADFDFFDILGITHSDSRRPTYSVGGTSFGKDRVSAVLEASRERLLPRFRAAGLILDNARLEKSKRIPPGAKLRSLTDQYTSRAIASSVLIDAQESRWYRVFVVPLVSKQKAGDMRDLRSKNKTRYVVGLYEVLPSRSGQFERLCGWEQTTPGE